MQARFRPLLLIGDAKYVTDADGKIVAGPFKNSVRSCVALDGAVTYVEYTDLEEAEKEAMAAAAEVYRQKLKAKVAAAHRLADLSPALNAGTATQAEKDEALAAVSKLFVGGKRG